MAIARGRIVLKASDSRGRESSIEIPCGAVVKKIGTNSIQVGIGAEATIHQYDPGALETLFRHPLLLPEGASKSGNPDIVPYSCPKCSKPMKQELTPGCVCSACRVALGYYNPKSANYHKPWPLPPEPTSEAPIASPAPEGPETPSEAPEPSHTTPMDRLLWLIGQEEYDRYIKLKSLEHILENL